VASELARVCVRSTQKSKAATSSKPVASELARV
jgi:hypothetical protein